MRLGPCGWPHHSIAGGFRPDLAAAKVQPGAVQQATRMFQAAGLRIGKGIAAACSTGAFTC